MNYSLETKDDKIIISAKSREEAWRKYFHGLKHGDLKKLGQILILKDEEGNEYPFRTAPSLVLLGLLDFPTGAANVSETIGIPGDEPLVAAEVLLKCMIKDMWILEEV